MFIIIAVLFAIILVSVIVPAIEDEIEYRRWLDETKEKEE